MADLKISQLTELEDLTGQEMIPLSTEGTNRRVSSGKMKEYISSDTVPYKVDIGAIMTGSPASATVSGGINEVKAAADANTEAIGDVSEILERINNETL